MPSGGPGRGQGRPKGVLNKRSMEIAKQAALTGSTPLEVMLEAMKFYQDQGNLMQAASVAKDAAPYMHPRLTALAVGGDPNAPPVKTESTLIYSGVLADADKKM